MAVIVLPANGDALELIPAASVRGFIQNTSASSIEVANAADPTNGLLVSANEMIDIGKPTAWTAAWTGRSPNGIVATVRVVFE